MKDCCHRNLALVELIEVRIMRKLLNNCIQIRICSFRDQRLITDELALNFITREQKALFLKLVCVIISGGEHQVPVKHLQQLALELFDHASWDVILSSSPQHANRWDHEVMLHELRSHVDAHYNSHSHCKGTTLTLF